MLLTAFCFSGVFLQGQDRKRLTHAENQSDRGQRQRGNATQDLARLKISTANGFKPLTATNYTPEQSKSNTSEFSRLHGSRLERSERLTDSARNLGTLSEAHRKRSRAGATTENTQNVNRFVNHSVNRNPPMHTHTRASKL